jgi:hypothetical protein
MSRRIDFERIARAAVVRPPDPDELAESALRQVESDRERRIRESDTASSAPVHITP